MSYVLNSYLLTYLFARRCTYEYAAVSVCLLFLLLTVLFVPT